MMFFIQGEYLDYILVFIVFRRNLFLKFNIYVYQPLKLLNVAYHTLFLSCKTSLDKSLQISIVNWCIAKC